MKQASDQPEYLPGVTARIEKRVPGQPLPVEFDVFQSVPDGQFDALFTANTLSHYAKEGVEGCLIT